MHGGKTVSVVFPAYNEEQYIRPALAENGIRIVDCNDCDDAELDRVDQ